MTFGSGDSENPGGHGHLGLISGLPLQLNPAAGMVSGGSVNIGHTKDDRVPQWSLQETRDFIAIRADLERDFTHAKQNKALWEAVASKMKEMGYRRSPEQCKCKWKNLVNRYKGKETSDPDNGRQCPFFDELHAIFTERARNMQRMLRESEAGSTSTRARKKMKRLSTERSSEDLTEEESEDKDDSEEERSSLARSGKRKPYRGGERTLRTASAMHGRIQELLQEWLRQQEQMETQWQEMMDRRERERRLFEQEWRMSMEKLERERLFLEQTWREREEQRRIREESRAEKRDALLTTLLNKLIHDDL